MATSMLKVPVLHQAIEQIQSVKRLTLQTTQGFFTIQYGRWSYYARRGKVYEVFPL